MTRYDFGNVVLVEFPQSNTTERKRRPALVILDIGDDDIVLAPITTVERTGKGDCRLMEWETCGLVRASWVRLAKITCLPKADIARRLGQLSPADIRAVNKEWQTLYAL